MYKFYIMFIISGEIDKNIDLFKEIFHKKYICEKLFLFSFEKNHLQT